MNLEIVSLNKDTYEQAVKLALEGETGNEADIRRRLKKFRQYFVALGKGKVVGEIGWYHDDGGFAGKALGKNFPYGKNIYWLGHFAVDPNFRGKGVGTALLEYLEDVIKKLGGRELWVYTDQARVFYEKVGFGFVQKAWIEECWEDVLIKKLEK